MKVVSVAFPFYGMIILLVVWISWRIGPLRIEGHLVYYTCKLCLPSLKAFHSFVFFILNIWILHTLKCWVKSWFATDSSWLEHDNTIWYLSDSKLTVLLNYGERHSSKFCSNSTVDKSFLFQTLLAEPRAIITSGHLIWLFHFLIRVWQMVRYCVSGSSGIWWPWVVLLLSCFLFCIPVLAPIQKQYWYL